MGCWREVRGAVCTDLVLFCAEDGGEVVRHGGLSGVRLAKIRRAT